jgi:hypothetical protein
VRSIFDIRSINHSNWHYSDTFWTIQNGKVGLLNPPDEGGLALEKIIEFIKLESSNAKDSDKAIAVAWLEHLIGDIHQPLHASARVTDLEPKGDQGANLFLLTPKNTPRDKQENLHSFWDGVIIKTVPNTKDACDSDYIDPIAKKIIKKYPFAKLEGPARFERPRAMETRKF